jgi:hypothetical protein
LETNKVPHFDDSINTTGCCPKFNPEGWEGVALHFQDKPFARATSRSLMYVPMNMGQVFGRVNESMQNAGAYNPKDIIVLSRAVSRWEDEHLFAISKPVPDEEAVTLSGDFVTKVFEGPYREMEHWLKDMQALAKEHGGTGDDIYFFYTTCPKCAKSYGQNYVVGVARTG